MGTFELIALAIGLAMDAFAVAVCKGMALDNISFKKAAIVGLWFGGFQAGMPLIGYFLGSQFEKYITPVDHWIALILLCAIGINMIKEAFSKKECDPTENSLAIKTMFVMAVATSIDALAVGVTFVSNVNVILAVSLIGIITFVISMIGVKIGHEFGTRVGVKAEFAGGAILILLGIKILLQHLGVISF